MLSSKGRDGVGRAMAGQSIWFLLYVHDRAGCASPASKGSATPEVYIMRFGPGICSAALLTEFFLKLDCHQSIDWTTGIDSHTELFCTTTTFSIKAAQLTTWHILHSGTRIV